MPRAKRRSLAALFLCGIGIATIAAAISQSRFASETRGFTRTRGRIVAAHVDEAPAPAEEGGPRFRAVLRYAYEAAGRTYESDRISVGATSGSPSSDPGDARRWIERYRPGDEVDVWFDPADPRRAVLVRGIPPAQLVAGTAIGVALVGAGFFVLARQRPRRS